MFPSRSASGSKIDYASVDYWDQRYAHEEHFEWLDQGYGPMLDLILRDVPDQTSRILILGCGNSRLSADLYDHGYHEIVSTDLSRVVIKNQSHKHRDKTGLEWQVLDMTSMPEEDYPDGSFDVVLEKTTLDSLLANERSQWTVRPETRTKILATLAQVSRVLRPGGQFLSLTFAQPHFRYIFNLSLIHI